jgi:radical SAM protein with 4Fe4S-binding SPASM domain
MTRQAEIGRFEVGDVLETLHVLSSEVITTRDARFPQGPSAPREVLTLNIDSMQLSQLCSFSSPGSIPLADAHYDIYDPVLWQAARRYIVERIDMLRKDCQGCDVLGVCQGACVNNGVTLANRLNAASCNYQRQTWRHAIDYAFDGTLRAAEPGSGQETVGEGGPARPHSDGCGHAQGAGATREANGSRVWALTPVD